MPAITPALHGGHVEEAVLATLRAFMPSYLAEMADNRDLPRNTYRVASYARSATVDKRFPEEALPCVVIGSGRKASNGQEADGSVSAWFEIAVGVLVADQQRDTTSDVAYDYATAVEAILIQQPTLQGFAVTTDWQDTFPEDIGVSKQRTLAGVIVEALVLVDPILNALDGPPDPPDDPDEPLPTDPTVLTVDIDVQPADD